MAFFRASSATSIAFHTSVSLIGPSKNVSLPSMNTPRGHSLVHDSFPIALVVDFDFEFLLPGLFEDSLDQVAIVDRGETPPAVQDIYLYPGATCSLGA